MLKKLGAAFGTIGHKLEDKFLSDDVLTTADYEFMRYVTEYNKSYATKSEFSFRSEIFKNTLKEVQEWNADSTNTSQMGINHMADWTHKEYKKLLGYKSHMKKEYGVVHLDDSNLADDINWVTKGAVTAVKDQKQCGSCWAFSTTGSIEGADQIAGGDLTSLSEQQLVDCSNAEGNKGCQGGLMDNGFDYVKKHPLETESEYPYKAKNEKCKAKGAGVGHISSYKDVESDSATQLKAAIMKGPVSIAVEGDKSVFQHYTSGVITSRTCGKKLDHGVLAVGYGSDGNGQGYFLVKNSWGASWGAEGYLKIGDEASNICGILSQPSYPMA